DRAAVCEDLRLTLDLMADGPLDRAHRVDVLRLGARSQRRGSFAFGHTTPQRDVGVATQICTLEPCFGDAKAANDVAYRRDIGLRYLSLEMLFAIDDIRYDLYRQHSGPIVVDGQVLRSLEATGSPAHVSQLVSILFHMSAFDRD